MNEPFPPEPRESAGGIRPAVPVLLLTLAVIILVGFAFQPGLECGFVDWDDPAFVLANPDVTDCTLDAIGRFFLRFYNGNYLPLTMCLFGAQYRLFGPEPFLFHLTNLLFHLGCVILVMRLFRRWLGRAGLDCPIMAPANTAPHQGRLWFWAGGGAILWGAHPLRVESVVWVTELKDVLYGFFYLLAIDWFLAFRDSGHRGWYAASLGSFLFSLLAKGQAVTLPLVLPLIAFWESGSGARERNGESGNVSESGLRSGGFWLSLVPFFALALVFGLIALAGQRHSDAIATGAPPWVALFVGCHGLLFYLGKTVWPFDLSAFYPYPPGLSLEMPLMMRVAPVIVLFAATAILLLRRHRELVFGFLWFVATIFPVLQFLPAGPVMAADRFTYVPGIGLALMCSIWLFRLSARLGGSPAFLPRLLLKGMLFAGVGLIFGTLLLTRERCQVWFDSVALWNDVVRQYPHPMAFEGRGIALLKAGRADLAERDLSVAARRRPPLPKTLNALGVIALERGAAAAAEGLFREALTVKPEFPDALSNQGMALLRLGRASEALDVLDRAIRLQPQLVEALNNRGAVFRILGDLERSRRDLEEAVRLAPGDQAILANRAETLRMQSGGAKDQSDGR